jgi:hypothetical protein
MLPLAYFISGNKERQIHGAPYTRPTTVAQVVKLPIYIQVVSDSNLHRNTDYPEKYCLLGYIAV